MSRICKPNCLFFSVFHKSLASVEFGGESEDREETSPVKTFNNFNGKYNEYFLSNDINIYFSIAAVRLHKGDKPYFCVGDGAGGKGSDAPCYSFLNLCCEVPFSFLE